MFDFTPVGARASRSPGCVFLAFGWRLLPRGRKGAASIDAAFNIEGYTTEVVVPADSPLVGKTVARSEKRWRGRGRGPHAAARPQTAATSRRPTVPCSRRRHPDPGGRAGGAGAHRRRSKLKLVRDDKNQEVDTPTDEIGVMEAVVTADSPLVDRTPAQIRLYRALPGQPAGGQPQRRAHHAPAALGQASRPATSSCCRAISTPCRRRSANCAACRSPQRDLPLGRGRRSLLPVLVLLGRDGGWCALHVLPVAIAFFGAAVAMLLIRALTLREAYEMIEWPILVMLGALIPVSDALRTTGGTDLIAGWLSRAGEHLPPFGALALIMVAAMAVTPFLNNAATVLVMAPIAASFAKKLGYNPDPFLMAVAIGAACDFLTPIGHQCNTLVMGPGGYRFGDYWRLGLPLSIIVVVVGRAADRAVLAARGRADNTRAKTGESA